MHTIVRARSYHFRVSFLLIRGRLATFMFTLGTLQAGKQKKFKLLENTVRTFCKRSDSVRSELRATPFALEDWKSELRATGAALLDESESLQALVLQFSTYRPLGAPVVASLATAVVSSVQSKLVFYQRKNVSFKRLVQAIDSDTFYWDLLIWLVVPMSNIDTLLGDLAEEYILQISSDGEASAREWYRKQVMATAGAYIWKRFERLMAVGSLVDWMIRWFRR